MTDYCGGPQSRRSSHVRVRCATRQPPAYRRRRQLIRRPRARQEYKVLSYEFSHEILQPCSRLYHCLVLFRRRRRARSMRRHSPQAAGYIACRRGLVSATACTAPATTSNLLLCLSVRSSSEASLITAVTVLRLSLCSRRTTDSVTDTHICVHQASSSLPNPF